MTPHETAFEMAVSSIRFGNGVTREVGMDLAELGARHVLVVTDPGAGESRAGCTPCWNRWSPVTSRSAVYDRVRVEPTDESFQDAIALRAARTLRRASSPWAAAPPSTPPRP